MLREARAWPLHVRDRAFVAFRHRHENAVTNESQAVLSVQQATDWLKSHGYSIKNPVSNDASLPVVVAKKGAYNRLGYIFAHLAIVVISLGGLLDSEIPTRAAAWWWEKAPINLAGLNSAQEVPASAKMPQATPTYRANLLLIGLVGPFFLTFHSNSRSRPFGSTTTAPVCPSFLQAMLS
jgi:cytochrome c biogenesis protein